MSKRLSRPSRPAVLVPVAVRTRLAVDDASVRFAEGLGRRVARLRDDGEAGSQVAEYALIGGVGAAACGGLVKILQESTLLRRLLSAVINALVELVTGWF